jgi:MATE family multidrug resistance protein
MTPNPPTLAAATTWWTKPDGGREVLRVAAPLVVSSLSWTMLTFIDRMMLNHVSGSAMAGAFSASIAWFAVAAFPIGVCTYANTFVAQYDGSHQPHQIGRVVWQTVWIALGFGLLFVIAAPLAPWLFNLARSSGTQASDAATHQQTLVYEIQFFKYMCAGGPALLLAQSIASFYSGRGQTWVMMIVEASIDVACIGLDYCWIFGHYGFPAWGVTGAASATVVCLWLKALVYLVLFLRPRHRERFGTLAGLRIDRELIRRILHYGGPSGVQMLLDVTGFTVFILLVGQLGGSAAEATSMAFSVSSLAFMPIYGLHIATSVLVGERLGEDRDDMAASVAITSLQIALGYMSLISLMYVFVPDVFLSGFFSHSASAAATHETVRHTAAMLLKFVAAYNLLDATQMIFVGALKGAGDTRFLLRVSVVLGSLLAGFSWLCVRVWKVNIYGCWTLVVFWCLIAAVTYVARFKQGRWRKMRVIDMAHRATTQESSVATLAP